MDKEKILELLQYGEHINLECKKAEGKIPNSIWETYSSFANTNGGIILLGIEENMAESDVQKRFSFGTVNNPTQRLIDFWNTLNSEKVSSNILVDADAGICEIEQGTILWIRVPQADYHNKPVFINGNPYKGTFKRNHEGDYHCSVEEVKAMLRDANDAGNDGGLLTGYTMKDIDVNTLRSYRIEFEHRNPEHIWNGDDDQTFLKNMGGYALDRNTQQGWLTAAGLLMFGKGLAVRERFDNIRMDYLDESNLLPDSRWSDRLTYDGTWENNLYNFVRQITPRLVKGVKRPFHLKGMTRIDDTPVHRAIREALVNMVIHSDYMITGILKVSKLDQGFTFSNPGNLKLPVQAIYEGGHSVARNPRIQQMFRMIGLGDNIGSGFPTILKAWQEELWRKPDLRQNEELHQVELKLWTISLMPAECIEYMQKLFGKVYGALDSKAQIILATAYLENEVSNGRLQSILDMHSVDIGHLLANLVEQKMLLQANKGRWTTYRLNTDYVTEIKQSGPSLVGQNVQFKNKTDSIIYAYVCAQGRITVEQAQKITNLKSREGARKAINRLRERKLLQMVTENGKKEAYYEGCGSRGCEG